ncbi:hypothetical protein ACU4GD_16675 [Cupriavidus basilensis]
MFAQPEAKGEMMTAPGKAAFSETTKVAATVMKIGRGKPHLSR